MANVAIHRNGSDEIQHFIVDCIVIGNKYIGSSKTVSGIKPQHFVAMWTNDIANPILDDGIIIGYDKKVSELTPCASGAEVFKTDKESYQKAVKVRAHIANMTYFEIDEYIDKNVKELSDAKDYLKKLSKVVLSIIKMQDAE